MRRWYIGAALILAALLTVPAGAQYDNQPPTPSVPVFKQYTITATATSLCSSGILDSSHIPNKVTIKNANGAANAAYIGGQTVANTPTGAGIELAADQAYTFTRQAPCEIYIVGTANAANIAFIVAEY